MTEPTKVIVTTQHRGVFYGILEGQDQASTVLTLHDARMIVYWPASVGGILGLASRGALPGTRVSPPVREITLQNVTAVWPVEATAAESIEAGPWT